MLRAERASEAHSWFILLSRWKRGARPTHGTPNSFKGDASPVTLPERHLRRALEDPHVESGGGFRA
eukprot:4645281-Alexandrium_andersonii.AAC.1